jgi:3',5'-cyclic AMP phosphodiesterase CpdA
MDGARPWSRHVAGSLGAVALAWVAAGGCGATGEVDLRRRSIPDAATDGSVPDGSAEASADADAASEVLALVGAPLIFAPTAQGFGLNAVLAGGDPAGLRVSVRAEGTEVWGDAAAPSARADDIAQWAFEGLEPGTRYEYRIIVEEDGEEAPLYSGSVVTQREAGESFSFALLTDTHIPPREVRAGDLATADFQEQTLLEVAAEIGPQNPDFIVNLGDMLDFHLFGFNDPPPDGSWTRLAYLNYRRLFADTLGNAAHFAVIGNWDGENGSYAPDEIERSREQRLLYVPGPRPDTYPEGGNDDEDYYAFTWGDALFIVLNVMTYTPTEHLLGTDPGVPDDWTLGEPQLAFLRETLEAATSKWRFVLIHHAVGGAAGNLANAAYGRGGGQAARVGEQAIVHELMLEHDVRIFFYGHDHVFTDIVVDDIHYTLPGSAGAPWKFTTAETGYAEYWPDSGHGRVQVSPDAVSVEFIALGGEVIYSYSIE